MLSIDKILQEVEKLNKEDQLLLLKRLHSIVHREEASTSPSTLSSISGLGSFIWANTDIDNYLDKERQW